MEERHITTGEVIKKHVCEEDHDGYCYYCYKDMLDRKED